jgi:hypothetical protein
MKKVFMALFGLLILGGMGFGVWYFLQQKSAGEIFTKCSRLQILLKSLLLMLQKIKTYRKTLQYQPGVWLITGTITDSNVPNIKCDFTGTIQFYAKGKALFVEPAMINLDPQCQQIAFFLQWKSVSQKIFARRCRLFEGYFA